MTFCKATQDGARVNPKSCNHFEKRSATDSDWGGQSEARTNRTSCNSGLSKNYPRFQTATPLTGFNNELVEISVLFTYAFYLAVKINQKAFATVMTSLKMVTYVRLGGLLCKRFKFCHMYLLRCSWKNAMQTLGPLLLTFIMMKVRNGLMGVTQKTTLRAGSYQAWGHDNSRALFSLRNKGHFLKIKRALLRSLQLLGARAPSAPGSYVYGHSNYDTSTFTLKTGTKLFPIDLITRYGHHQPRSQGVLTSYPDHDAE